MDNPAPAVAFENISKEFSGTVVLSGINLFFEEGRIHAIVGENGAGKSTLMNILSGVLPPTAGTLRVNSTVTRFTSPRDAEALGIGMVHQHFMLIDILNVWQNIVLGSEPGNRFHIDRKAAFARIDAVCSQYGMSIDKNKPVGLLTVGEQQRVEILKVLYRNAKYIIFDEPTAVLTPAEIESLLDAIRQLKSMGKTIFFISHKLEEVIHAADTITVLRDGKCQGKENAAGAKVEDIIHKMVGRDIDLGRRVPGKPGEEALRIENLLTAKRAFNCPLDGLSLSVRRGEIAGVAGVDGNGQRELVDAILGMERPLAGRIFLAGKDITGEKTPSLRRERIACIPPDRQEQALVLDESVLRNAALGGEDRIAFKKGPFLSRTKVEKSVRELVSAYNVRCTSLDQPVRGLSGGNQQKLILARECEWKGSELILAVNPTRGLDIGAIEAVYRKLNEYKAAGKAVLLVSTELQEILTLSDSIAVLFRGRINFTTENRNVSVDEIGSYMAGVEGRGKV